MRPSLPGADVGGEGRVATANTAGRASPYRDCVAVLAVDGFAAGNADERLFFGRYEDGGLGGCCRGGGHGR
jgi:hypothetical protein